MQILQKIMTLSIMLFCLIAFLSVHQSCIKDAEHSGTVHLYKVSKSEYSD